MPRNIESSMGPEENEEEALELQEKGISGAQNLQELDEILKEKGGIGEYTYAYLYRLIGDMRNAARSLKKQTGSIEALFVPKFLESIPDPGQEGFREKLVELLKKEYGNIEP